MTSNIKVIFVILKNNVKGEKKKKITLNGHNEKTVYSYLVMVNWVEGNVLRVFLIYLSIVVVFFHHFDRVHLQNNHDGFFSLICPYEQEQQFEDNIY